MESAETNGPTNNDETELDVLVAEFEKLDVEDQEAALDFEVSTWSAMGMSTYNVPINRFMLNGMVIAIQEVLSEKLGVDKDEIDRIYRKTMFKNLVNTRREAAAQKQENGKPKLVLPPKDIKTP
jgi:hypothetical protein